MSLNSFWKLQSPFIIVASTSEYLIWVWNDMRVGNDDRIFIFGKLLFTDLYRFDSHVCKTTFGNGMKKCSERMSMSPHKLNFMNIILVIQSEWRGWEMSFHVAQYEIRVGFIETLQLNEIEMSHQVKIRLMTFSH